MPTLPLVLLPGTLCDARVWRAQVGAFSGQRSVTVCELGEQATLQEEVASYLSVLPQRFLLAGFSLGGILAFELYRQARSRIAGLALLATNARPDPEASQQKRHALVALAQAGQMDTVLDDALLPHYFAATADRDEALRSLVVSMAHATADRFAHQSMYASDRPDSRPLLGSIDVPVLLLHGEKDRVTPLDRHLEMAAEILAATAFSFPDCGHFVTLEAPGECTQAMSAWMGRIDH